MVCHGELARLKPRVEHLTSFYLSLSIGGALGGVFVALIAPHVFSAVYEYPISYVAVAVLVLVVFWREQDRWWRLLNDQGGAGALLTAVAATLLLAIYGGNQMWDELKNSVAKERNFYGALLVEDYKDEEHKTRLLSHGTITHGVQILDANFTTSRRPTMAASPARV